MKKVIQKKPAISSSTSGPYAPDRQLMRANRRLADQVFQDGPLVGNKQKIYRHPMDTGVACRHGNEWEMIFYDDENFEVKLRKRMEGLKPQQGA